MTAPRRAPAAPTGDLGEHNVADLVRCIRLCLDCADRNDYRGGAHFHRRRRLGDKTDLAPYVHASLEVMDADSRMVRRGKPFLFTNCLSGEGIADVVAAIRRDVLFDVPPAAERAR